MQINSNCELIWDNKRGVLYVYDNRTRATLLTVRNIPKCEDSVKLSQGQIDVVARDDKTLLPTF